MTDSDRCANFTGSQAQQLVSASTKEAVGQNRQERIQATQKAMTTAFVRWHVTGCFTAAAEYNRARTEWELALMGLAEDSIA